MRGYVSVDIETTGIADNAHILQISAVYDDLKTPIDQLKTFDVVIKYDVMTHCEPYAMGMNAALLKKMMSKDFKTCDVHKASTLFLQFLDGVQEIDEKGRKQKIIFAGKNVASFDIPKITNFLPDHKEYRGHFTRNIVHYKTLDVGSLYYDVFKDNVSLSKINELTNRPAVSHNALDDAFDVVYAVRHKLGIK